MRWTRSVKGREQETEGKPWWKRWRPQPESMDGRAAGGRPAGHPRPPRVAAGNSDRHHCISHSRWFSSSRKRRAMWGTADCAELLGGGGGGVCVLLLLLFFWQSSFFSRRTLHRHSSSSGVGGPFTVTARIYSLQNYPQ